ncbi:lipocalin family protein [Elizabethkingia ursingii]|uniref:lipocalin family protein n=1 Tax=Elizabethkingia ursingii TaxID=1756150 RepID=UPI002011DFBC|nr:lipocalin family protein [Elizabethkingia ursingii]MCL1667856.1 lipocalin family protein [Elizabethkingia ursingii]
MKLKLFFLFIAAFLAIGSCSSRDNDNDRGPEIEKTKVYGNWRLESLTIEGNGQRKVFNDECFRRSTILFNGADGKGVERGYESISTPGICKDSGNLNFTFSIEGSTIYQTYTNGQKDEARVDEVTNTTLVVSQNKTIDNIKVRATMKYIKA